ncbi:MAG: 3-deoxy-7-phosphoheptulonate synthase, partial [Gammaproteobacteria bacterium]|nr:3-deoxy-7-phosphoheptulonate synthase [Gammaproteobacteria bacterium]
MIVILKPNTDRNSHEYRQLMNTLENLPNIKVRLHEEVGTQQTLTELYLVGDTAALTLEEIQNLPTVERVVRISQEYRVLGRHKDESRPTHFEYNGVRFGQDNLNVFAGLCAV